MLWNFTQANHCFKIGKVILLQWTSQPTLKNSSIKRQPQRVIRMFILSHMWCPYGVVAHRLKVCSPLWLYFLLLFLQLSSDIKVIADDGHMMVPKVPLCMASPVFDSMLNSDFQESYNNEVQLPGKSLETIEFIARYINLREPCPIQGEWNNTRK